MLKKCLVYFHPPVEGTKYLPWKATDKIIAVYLLFAVSLDGDLAEKKDTGLSPEFNMPSIYL